MWVLVKLRGFEASRVLVVVKVRVVVKMPPYLGMWHTHGTLLCCTYLGMWHPHTVVVAHQLVFLDRSAREEALAS